MLQFRKLYGLLTCSSGLRQHGAFRDSPGMAFSPAMLAWPLACLLGAAGLWALIEHRLQAERQAALAAGREQAAMLANAYALQAGYMLRNLDHINLNLRHQWQQRPGDLAFADQFQGPYAPLSTSLQAAAYDRQGNLLATTLDTVQRSNVLHRADFRECMGDDAGRLRISGPLPAAFNGRDAVCFARPLLDRNSRFDGMLSVCVAPSYLASFHRLGGMGQADFHALVRRDGSLLAWQGGAGAPAGFARNAAAFSGNQGIVRLPGSVFDDAAARIVAWQALEHYDLVAAAGIAEPAVLASHARLSRAYRSGAAGAALLLAVLAMTGTVLTGRLAWRKRLAAQIRDTYLMAMDGGREGFFMVRALHDPRSRAMDFIVEDCNERGAAHAGLSRQALLRKRFSELAGSAPIADLAAACRHAMATGFHEEELEGQAGSDGAPVWLHRRFVRSGSGLAVTIRDISDARAHQETLARMASTDALTGLPNRRWLMDFLPQAIAAAAGAGSMLAVLFIDLDDFKSVNDMLGHDAGDALLKAASGRLASAIRREDKLVRLGGDEFIIVLEQVGQEEIVQVAERIVAAMAEPFMLGQSACRHAPASLGISRYPYDGSNAALLLRHADLAMYVAKRSGKGRYAFHADACAGTVQPAAALSGRDDGLAPVSSG